MAARLNHRCLFVSECDWGERSSTAPEWRALAEALVRLGVRCQAVGQATAPDVPERASQSPEAKEKLLKVLHEQMERFRPTSAVIQFGEWTGDLIAACRDRGVPASVALTDSRCLDPRPLAGADAVVCPSRFLADYYRDAFALPCVYVPPAVHHLDGWPNNNNNNNRVVLFDASAASYGRQVSVQIAKEVARRTANGQPVSFVAIGDAPSQDPVNELPLTFTSERRAHVSWGEAAVFVSPHLSWDPPMSALSAMRHGVPLVAATRGSGAEWFAECMIGPLPEAATAAVPAVLDENVLDAWVSEILRLLDDRPHAEAASASSLRFAERWSPDRAAETFRLFLDDWMRRTAGDPNRSCPPRRRRPQVCRLSRRRMLGRKFARSIRRRASRWIRLAMARPKCFVAVPPSSKLVVELGSWTGLSTRFLAEPAPQATIVSVDPSNGTEEHRSDPKFAALLPKLFDAFQSRCWPWRDRLIPMRMSSLDGLHAIAAAGLAPDVIFFHAKRAIEQLSAELIAARDRFPKAMLCGGGYDRPDIRRAVAEFARGEGMSVERHQAESWRLLEGWQIPDRSLAPPCRREWAVFVPHLNGIEWECESELRNLEAAGVRVVRRRGSSQIDLVRAELFSEALHDGIESLLFIDADIGFDAHDALRLLARPEDAVSGVIAKKGVRGLASRFDADVKQIVFGPDAPGLYPLAYAGTGFFRVHAPVLRRMIEELQLPLCNTQWGRGVWPFVLPILLPQEDGKIHYLGEDWSFCNRLKDIGVTPLADTTIRLWHWGRYPYGWEDAGSDAKRFRSYTFQLG
ncbi:MAG: hypothetical protein U0744_10285 [Gemmataceae bacterium]